MARNAAAGQGESYIAELTQGESLDDGPDFACLSCHVCRRRMVLRLRHSRGGVDKRCAVDRCFRSFVGVGNRHCWGRVRALRK